MDRYIMKISHPSFLILISNHMLIILLTVFTRACLFTNLYYKFLTSLTNTYIVLLIACVQFFALTL